MTYKKCSRGHEMTLENTVIALRPDRASKTQERCKICWNQSSRNWYKRKNNIPEEKAIKRPIEDWFAERRRVW